MAFMQHYNKSVTPFIRNGPAWSEIRKPLQDKMLRPKVVSRFLPMINSITDDLVTIIKNREQLVDINKYMLDYALESK